MFFTYTLQFAIVLATAGVVWMWQSTGVAMATLYGGSVALVNVGLLLWRWRRGRYDYHCDGQRHLQQFHRSSLERFFVVGVVLALGMYGLRLDPLAVLLGFIAGQAAWMVSLNALKTD